MLYWKGLSVLQSLHSDKILSDPPDEEKKVFENIHVDQGISAPIQEGAAGARCTLPNETNKGANKILRNVGFQNTG